MEKNPESGEVIYPKTLDILKAQDKLRTARMNLALKKAAVEAAHQEVAAAEAAFRDVLAGDSADTAGNGHPN